MPHQVAEEVLDALPQARKTVAGAGDAWRVTGDAGEVRVQNAALQEMREGAVQQRCGMGRQGDARSLLSALGRAGRPSTLTHQIPVFHTMPDVTALHTALRASRYPFERSSQGTSGIAQPDGEPSCSEASRFARSAPLLASSSSSLT